MSFFRRNSCKSLEGNKRQDAPFDTSIQCYPSFTVYDHTELQASKQSKAE